MKNKIKLLILSSSFLAIIIMILGITYAFFSINIIGNDESSSLRAMAGVLELTYDGSATISGDLRRPGRTISKTFTVENTGNKTINSYDIYFSELFNEFSNNELKYTLECTSSSGTCTGISTQTNVPTTSSLMHASSAINAGVIHTYTLTITFIETGSNQNYNQKSLFKSKITINELIEFNSINNILAEKTIVTSGSGLYHADGTQTTDNYGEQYYYKGTNTDNYVWYSGKLWRIVSSDASGTKLITEDSIVSLVPNTVYYQSNRLREWVEGPFYNTLRSPETYLADRTWYASATSAGVSLSETIEISENYTGNIGMITIYEYNRSVTGSNNSYLVNDSTYCTATTNQDIITTMYTDEHGLEQFTSQLVDSIGIVNNNGILGISSSRFGIRPTINLKSSINVVSGNGTKNNPYRLEGDNDTISNATLANTRYSGEYIKYSGYLWRIVNVTDGITKLVMNEYYNNNEWDSSNSNTRSFQNTTLYSHLNNYFYNSLESPSTYIQNSNWYNSVSYTSPYDYSTLTSGTPFTGNVGLLRIDEPFSGVSPDSKQSIAWTLTPYSTSYVWAVSYDGDVSGNSPKAGDAARPSINLKSSINITSGKGTRTNPFVVGTENYTGDNNITTPVTINTLLANKSTVSSGSGLYSVSDPYYGSQRIYKGTNTDNYVWYSGKLWRIVSSDASGTKLITEDSIVTLFSNTVYYQSNRLREWIEGPFYDTLRSTETYLADRTWYASATTYTDDKTTEISENYTGNIGLITIYEYNRSVTGSDNSYLVNDSNYWTATAYSTSSVWYVSYYGYVSNISLTYGYAARPTINLKSSINVVSGNGTKNNPYRLEGDNDTISNATLANTRYSGEYIKYSGYLWRIVNVTDGITKLVMNEYYNNNEWHSSNSNAQAFQNTTLYSHLNNYFYNSLESPSTYIQSSNWYNDVLYTDTTSYDYSTLTSGTPFTGNVGLLRIDEPFSGVSPDSKQSYTWTLTPYSTSSVWPVYYVGNVSYLSPARGYAARPSINLKSSINITSGKGTRTNPFVLN